MHSNSKIQIKVDYLYKDLQLSNIFFTKVEYTVTNRYYVHIYCNNSKELHTKEAKQDEKIRSDIANWDMKENRDKKKNKQNKIHTKQRHCQTLLSLIY